MKSAVQEGDILSFIAPYAVAAGAPFKVGAFVAIAQNTTASGAAVEGQMEGVYNLPKTSAQAWAIGDKVYWDDTNKVMTTVSTSNTLVGAATAVAANPSSVGQVYLDGAVR